MRSDSARPLPAESGSQASDALADLSRRIALRLGDIDAALRAHPGRELDEARRAVAELQDLLGRQLAVQLSHVERQVAERTEELASLSNFLQTHSEREKALLARELHDALGGILTPAKMDLAWLEERLKEDPSYAPRMKRLSLLIDQGIDLKRRIIETLHPSLLDHLGLPSALTWYMDEACRAAGIQCELRISDKLERLPSDLEIALYRLVQESLSNTVRHARAKKVLLELERQDQGLRLALADDGVGIEDLEHAKRASHGLAGMMHRVRSVNGTFEVRSEPGKGTRIEVFVPLPRRPVSSRAS